jgi:hypothetical protein
MRQQMTWQRRGKQQTCLQRSLSPCSMARCCRQPTAAIRMRQPCSQCRYDRRLPAWRQPACCPDHLCCQCTLCGALRAKLQWDCTISALVVIRYPNFSDDILLWIIALSCDRLYRGKSQRQTSCNLHFVKGGLKLHMQSDRPETRPALQTKTVFKQHRMPYCYMCLLR